MEVQRPQLIPAEPPDRAEMHRLQVQVRRLARFEDENDRTTSVESGSVIVGADLAFDGDDAISAVVAMRDGETIEQATTRVPVAFPYVPGFLAFREARPITTVLAELSVTPDVLLCDGNGRIHPCEAGLATHVGVALDLPTVGVAKRLLCGWLEDPPDNPLPAGTRIPVLADADVDAPRGTRLGYAVQTRQWEGRAHAINPVYVSPGHRVSAEGAADLVLACCDGYKLPEPIRLADRLAGQRATGDG